MQETARRSHAACQSFFTVRRATWLCARRSTALVLTRTCCTQSRLRGIPRFEISGRPASVAIEPGVERLSSTMPGRDLFSTDIEAFATLRQLYGTRPCGRERPARADRRQIS